MDPSLLSPAGPLQTSAAPDDLTALLCMIGLVVVALVVMAGVRHMLARPGDVGASDSFDW